MCAEQFTTLINDLHNARRLFGPDWQRRIEVAQRLGDLRSTEAVKDLEAVVKENKHPELTLAALNALGCIGGDKVLEALGRTISQSSDQRIFQAVVSALMTDGSLRALKTLLERWNKLNPSEQGALRSALAAFVVPSGSYAREALALLGSIGPDAASVLSLIALGEDETNAMLALQSLAAMRSAGISAILTVLMKNPSEKVRNQALEAVKGIEDQALPPLIIALSSSATRPAAIDCLVGIGHSAEEPLLKVLGEASEDDYPVILDLLERVSGLSKAELLEKYAYARTMRAARELAFIEGEGCRPYLPIFRALVRLDSEYALGHYWLAKMYAQVEDTANADKHYRRVIDATNRDELPHQFVAKANGWLAEQALNVKQDNEEARQHIAARLALTPDDPDALMQAGFAAEDMEQSLAFFEQSLEKKGNEVVLCTLIFDFAFKLLSKYLNADRFDESTANQAFIYLQKALTCGERAAPNWKNNPKHLNQLEEIRHWRDELGSLEQNRLALMYRLRGDWVVANVQHERQMFAKMGNQMNGYDLGKLQKQMLVEDAASAYRISIGYCSNYGVAWDGLVQAYEYAEEHSSALQVAEEGMLAAPRYWPIYFIAGALCEEYFKAYERAIRHYERGLTLNPSNAAGYTRLGACYAQIEMYDVALRHLQTAAKLGDPEAQAVLRKSQ
jgi:tetratricopeptide (TPR) repeat protein